ncbi:Putative acetamidase/formamidase [Corynebacterium glyciniphilum AJ 3170]|uniref:Putative acetamidase/formamidase n=1 Tax=Corynebacterium glyciniphilum AJ 3170 TaxID=1404245 RepID=X5DTH2_9CORY|nr:acetamidase/formamidase family protein [Corynebacterium glyciniphilum]AHW63962.1 Putative acetamidase/formamidase [Corynebacterium glyciniphilum AJ 3170]
MTVSRGVPSPADTADRLSRSFGRRRFLQIASAVGAAGAGSTLVGCSHDGAPAAAASSTSPGIPGEILQPGSGSLQADHYLASEVDMVLWGYLPSTDSEPVLRMKSGETVTVDTVSHEGILEDQGRDPDSWFGEKGVDRADVLDDAREIAANYDRTPRDFDKDGPHIVTGPIFVEGAEPGDVLKVETLETTLRVPYGVVSSRHGKGALRAMPDGKAPDGIDLDEVMPPVGADGRGENVSVFTRAQDGRGIMTSGELELSFPLRPFMGMMGVATTDDGDATAESRNSIPPTLGGGNIDIRHLAVGSALYLPVFTDGALFYTGDPHHGMGDGEVALTAMEGSLRTTFRLTVCKRGDRSTPSVAFSYPFGETEDAWIPIGLSDPDGLVNGSDRDLNVAMRRAVVNALDFLETDLGIERAVAYAYLSAASDFALSQVVDITTGVHGLIYKDGLPTLT